MVIISLPDLQQETGSACLEIESLLTCLVAERLRKTCDEKRL